MSATTRYFVAVNLNGRTQYYSRDSENLVSGRWTSVPQFLADTSKASPMLEPTATALVKRLRSLREDPWLVSMEGQRVDVAEDGQPFTEDTRTAVRATLDSDAAVANGTAAWYIVRPARTPLAQKWFINYNLPNRPRGQDQIYSDSAIEVLERAQQLHVLEYAEPAPTLPTPQPATPARVLGPRVRPGDRRVAVQGDTQ
jgi:hypothetical protein